MNQRVGNIDNQDESDVDDTNLSVVHDAGSSHNGLANYEGSTSRNRAEGREMTNAEPQDQQVERPNARVVDTESRQQQQPEIPIDAFNRLSIEEADSVLREQQDASFEGERDALFQNEGREVATALLRLHSF